MKARCYISMILGLPKTIYFNLKYFRLKDAIKLPVLISSNVKLKEMNGKIVLKEVSFGIIRIGINATELFDNHSCSTIWNVKGKVTFEGSARIGIGSSICVYNDGELVLGKNFRIIAKSYILAKKKIEFGDNVLMSWDNLIMDTDFHSIYDMENKMLNSDKDIIIGNNVWIGCRCTILKGTYICDGTVIGANSCVYDKIDKSNQVIGGNPVISIKENIIWKA